MGTSGGPTSIFNNFYAGPFFEPGEVLNKRGVFAGWADTSMPDPFPSLCLNLSCFVSHAFQWDDGVLTDLGTLAAGWSSQLTWINDTGEIVGLSQNGVIDPLIGFPEQRAVLWRNGQVTHLGTLGGNQSIALSGEAGSDSGDSIGYSLPFLPSDIQEFEESRYVPVMFPAGSHNL